MPRTTITLKEEILKKIDAMAQGENRSIPNLIETILMRHVDEDLNVDEFEMREINADTPLKKEIKNSLTDYKLGRGRFV